MKRALAFWLVGIVLIIIDCKLFHRPYGAPPHWFAAIYFGACGIYFIIKDSECKEDEVLEDETTMTPEQEEYIFQHAYDVGYNDGINTGSSGLRQMKKRLEEYRRSSLKKKV